MSLYEEWFFIQILIWIACAGWGSHFSYLVSSLGVALAGAAWIIGAKTNQLTDQPRAEHARRSAAEEDPR